MRERYAACPLCGGQARSFLKDGDCSRHPLYVDGLEPKVSWVRCDTCEHVFTDGHWSKDSLALIHDRATERHQPLDAAGLEHHRALSARIVEKVARFKAPGPRCAWLDVGFGNASLLFTAAEWGYEPHGIDVREEAVQELKERGIWAFSGEVREMTSTHGLAVVSFADSLEHMAFPKPTLMAARKLMMTSGALFISLPNMDSALWRQLDAENVNPYWNEIEHLHNFTRNRLQSLLRETGFWPVHYDISQRYRCCMEVIAYAI